MTMHPVWRVEHASDRSGPWTRSSRWTHYSVSGTADISRATPVPYTDVALTQAKANHPGWMDYVFGCKRPQDFIAYGFRSVWDALRLGGFVLRLYHAPTVLVGDTQLMFDPTTAVLLNEYLTLDEACVAYPSYDPPAQPRTVVPPDEVVEEQAYNWVTFDEPIRARMGYGLVLSPSEDWIITTISTV